jgi:PPM family protein phosphatase
MLKEYKNIYDIHRWLRCVTWIGLLCVALFLFWSLLWAVHHPDSLQPLALVAILSTAWFMTCGFLLWTSLFLLRHHLKQWRVLDPKLLKQQGDQNWVSSRDPSGNYQSGASSNSLSAKTTSREFPMTGYISADPLMGLRLPQWPQQTRTLAGERRGQEVQLPQVFHDRIEEVPTRLAAPARVASLSPKPAVSTLKPRSVQSTRVGMGWDPGIKRKHAPNEDSIAAVQGTCTYKEQLIPFDLFIVADGMGGHANGQEASRMAIQTMTQSVLQNLVTSSELTDAFFSNILAHGVQQANMTIWQCNQEKGANMGTTLTAALVIGPKAYVANVGDSRTYMYRRGKGLWQITRDHSLVARLAANGLITFDDIYTHPDRNLVERGLGDRRRLEVDCFTVDLHARDWILLCSDGLWEMVRDPEIERIIKKEGDPSQMSDLLVQAALKGGGVDNVSVIVARVM